MRKIEKEELIKIYENQIAGIQRLSHVSVPHPDAKETPIYSIKINYSVVGADVLHPNHYIRIHVHKILTEAREVIIDDYTLYSEINGSVRISKEEGDRLIEQLNSVVGELKKKNILYVH